MVFGGSIFSMVLIFILFALIARNISKAEFGFFALSYAIIKILSVLSGFGFQRGAPRYIAYHIGQEKYKHARDGITSSFAITAFFSLFIAGLLFLNAGLVSNLLNKPAMAGTLKTMSLIIPFMALNELLVCYLRGLKDVTGQVYFHQILRPLLTVILVFLVDFFGLPYIWVPRVYTISFSLTFIFLFLYAKRKIFNYIPIDSYTLVSKEIIVFSLPLLGAGLLFQVMMWVDTIVLGFFASAQSVGAYNCALRIAMLLTITVMSGAFIYLPLVSDLYAQKKLQKITAIYAAVTKWTFIITLPLFYLIFFGHEQILFYSFSAKYITAGPALKILSLGYIINIFFGLNAMTCVAIGETRAIIISHVVTLVVNLTLDILLIPEYGLIGAAFASSVSLVLANIIRTGYVYGLARIHPFSKDYIKLGGYAIGLGIVFSMIPIKQYLNHNIFYGMLFFLAVIILPFLGFIITKNLTKEDVLILLRFKNYIVTRLSKNSQTVLDNGNQSK